MTRRTALLATGLTLGLLLGACGDDESASPGGGSAASTSVGGNGTGGTAPGGTGPGGGTAGSAQGGGAGEGGGGGTPLPTYTCEPTRWATSDAPGGGDGSLASPWTLAEAMEQATAGDVVLVGPGVYVAASTGERYAPAWNPAQSGTDGAPIVFCAEYPAVHHTENRSELRNDAPGEGADASPTFGTLDRQYVVWDGFYVDEASSPSHPDTGPVGAWGSSYVTIARSVIEGATIEREDNHNGIRLELVEHVALLNNRISGFLPASSTNRNHTGIMTYDSSFVTIEHNEISGCIGGIYLKGDHADDALPNGAFTVRYNFVHDIVGQGITILGVTEVGGGPSVIAHNLVVRAGLGFLFNTVGPDHPAAVRMNHNTIVDCGNAIMLNAPETLFDVEVVRNLVVGAAPFYAEVFTDQNVLDVIANGFLSDDNHAFEHPEWAMGRSLAEWQSFCGLDLESSEGDPAFVDAANDDYHLGAGSTAATASVSNGPVGCYMTGIEVMGVEAP